ncbi:dUTP diphosphatase [Sporosarcina sp. OR05]|uniref:dUTP diphosphatase n=1 Tax=Sporosarcina sp. OR05 TaxID=2969819 RepID=UPI00352A96E1
MNLAKLFETQRKLDERIVKEKGLEGQDLLPLKILALQVELGELANEWRGFKFWSEDREPRTAQRNYARGSGKTIPPYIITNPLLEEYVDCLHFILSIGLEVDALNVTAFESIVKFGAYPNRNMIFVFNKLFAEIGMMGNDERSVALEYYPYVFQWFLELGCLLGFTWEQIEQAYYAKNQINQERQDGGY